MLLQYFQLRALELTELAQISDVPGGTCASEGVDAIAARPAVPTRVANTVINVCGAELHMYINQHRHHANLYEQTVQGKLAGY